MSFPFEISSSLLAAIVTTIAGLVTSFLSARLSKLRDIERDKIEGMITASGARAEEARTKLVSELIERLPPNLSPDEVVARLQSQFKIGGDVIVNQIVREGGDLITELVNGYHHQALSQAKVQFWFSIIAATVGFVFILVSASTTQLDTLAGVLKIVPGVIIDAVALLFFRQAEQTRQRATELYDRLRKDSQMTMSQRILDAITDPQIKSIAQAQIALHLAGLQMSEMDLASFIAKAHGQRPPSST